MKTGETALHRGSAHCLIAALGLCLAVAPGSSTLQGRQQVPIEIVQLQHRVEEDGCRGERSSSGGISINTGSLVVRQFLPAQAGSGGRHGAASALPPGWRWRRSKKAATSPEEQKRQEEATAAKKKAADEVAGTSSAEEERILAERLGVARRKIAAQRRGGGGNAALAQQEAEESAASANALRHPAATR